LNYATLSYALVQKEVVLEREETLGRPGKTKM